MARVEPTDGGEVMERKHVARTYRMGMLIGVFAACLLVACVLTAGPFAGRAHAAGGPLTASAQAAGELQAQAVKKYPIWIGHRQITSANRNDVQGDGGHVRYNPKTNTLTLSNARINGANITEYVNGSTYYEGILVKQDKGLKVVLKGKNTITVTGQATARSAGIAVQGKSSGFSKLSIRGSGCLKVQAGAAGVFSVGVACRDLSISGSVKATLCGGTMVSTSKEANASDSGYVGSRGVIAMGSFTLGGSAKLTATGKTRALFSAPSFGKGYTPQVRAGDSSKSIKVSKLKPAKGTYTKYKYVSISKAKATSKKPAKVRITKVTPMASGFSVYYKALSKNCTGYQIQLVLVRSGQKWTYNTASAKMNTARLTGLVGGEKYSVRIRAINKVGSKTHYGAWSATKSVTTYYGEPAG